MRVLFVSQEFPPETGWGGIGTYLGIISPALVRAGAEVHVLSVVPGQERSEKLVDGVLVHRAPLRRPRGVGRLTRLPLTWGRISLAAAVAREKSRLGINFDVCESPEWGAEGLVLAARRKLPMVVRLHSGAAQVFPYHGPLGLDQKLTIRCEEALVKRADVVTGTGAQVSNLPDRLGLDGEEIRTITYPISSAKALPPPQGRPRILFAGRFEARKAPDLLLRALPLLLEHVPDAELVLLGTDTGTADGGSYGAEMRRLVTELGVENATQIIDRWGRDAVEEELARATVCAVPSRWESFGYVAAEAAALGRPVVASRIPALQDVVRDGVTGRLVPPENPESLSEALAELLSTQSQLEKMGAAAARDIAERCDPDRIAEQTLQAYELAIARWNRREQA